MSVLEKLDATRICARWSPDDPQVWAHPVPVPQRPALPAPVDAYSWRALARNPQALLLTGFVGAFVAVDTAARLLPHR
ncbi:MAG TPA: hypothetical protein VHC23_13260 [Jatrophihabitans sp.]|nr:hypothetical protein [Jatrophihabitans sp.]